MTHFFRGVARLGNVAVSRHAQAQMQRHGISEETFQDVLLRPMTPDIKEGFDIVWREGKGIRIVILTDPTPNLGAKLVKTVFKVNGQAAARR